MTEPKKGDNIHKKKARKIYLVNVDKIFDISGKKQVEKRY
ncbi:hypothetical protein CWATWH0003_B079 [Crocosphaera watsonii WH 0003]|uniref:Uncharacterized protein n=1 Tax=Crocosphaera watsonii WH 0003 TaxID=423471 RepID=G5JE92_CROWT|nr:hypothetical protein CWATWH0003_B079 [Crocosphaera watsonii WH 0003]